MLTSEERERIEAWHPEDDGHPCTCTCRCDDMKPHRKGCSNRCGGCAHAESVYQLQALLASHRELEARLTESELHGTAMWRRGDKALAERDEARRFGEEAVARYNELLEDQRLLRCAFCDEMYPPGTLPTQHEVLTAHIKVCKKHPMRKLEAKVARLREALTLTDLHLQHVGPGLLTEIRRAGIEMPHDLWPNGDLDRACVNAWVKRVRRIALRAGEES